jgi:hypothetical protein
MIEPTPVAGVLLDYDVIILGGLELEIVPLPGAAINQIGLRTPLPQVGTVVLCGEIVHSPGKIPRMAPLQHFHTDILNGRQAAIATSDLVFQRVSGWLEYFDKIHRRVMPASDQDVHFDIDSQGGQLRPYGRLLREPGSRSVRPSAIRCRGRRVSMSASWGPVDSPETCT